MNIYVVRQATQGLANWVKTQGGNQTVAISYDSRIRVMFLPRLLLPFSPLMELKFAFTMH